jgi:hypothetical protein
MAMRTERHGNLFAKLNYGNVSDGRIGVQEKGCVLPAARIGDPVMLWCTPCRGCGRQADEAAWLELNVMNFG